MSKRKEQDISVFRALVNSQVWLSRKFDGLLPADYRVDGNRDFLDSLVPKYLQQELTIYDIGGGKNPYLSSHEKRKLNAHVVGLDVDPVQLSQAPAGAYDNVICTDIANYRGEQQADIVICQSLLEHVRDVEAAFAAIASILKPGGLALLFVPSRNAVFARLNILLPQEFKKKLLHTIFPKTKGDQGFPSFYDKCTPDDFKRLANDNAFSLVEARYFFKSSYFSFFFPAWVLWRLWVILFRALKSDQAAETFSMVLRKLDGQLPG